MKYIEDGVSVSPNHLGQVAHSDDGQNWSFIIKGRIREITGYKTFVRLWFDQSSHFEINLLEVLGRPTWSTGNQAGLTAAMEDISAWLADDSVEKAIEYIKQIKRFEFATSGSKIIQSSNGLVHGNWFAVRTHEDTVFTTVTDNGSNLVGASIPAGFTYPERNMLFTSDLDGNGFTGIQVQSGTVEAYNK
jgi:hypothetical protein